MFLNVSLALGTAVSQQKLKATIIVMLRKVIIYNSGETQTEKKNNRLSHEVLIQLSLSERIECMWQQNSTALLLSIAFKFSTELIQALFYQNKHSLTNYRVLDITSSYFAQCKISFFEISGILALFQTICACDKALLALRFSVETIRVTFHAFCAI